MIKLKPFDSIFNFLGTMKVFIILAKEDEGELNISEIVHRSRMNSITCSNHVSRLRSSNILQEKRFGKIRIICLNPNIPQVKVFKFLIVNWESNIFLDLLRRDFQ